MIKENPVLTLQFKKINITDSFWTPRLKLNKETAIFYQWDQLEKTKNIDNFRILAGLKEGFREGFFFSDSDAYKWLDAACRILQQSRDVKLESIVNEFIELIIKGQEEDGYIFTFNQIHFPSKRWQNLWKEHEMYCLGHLIEAAISHNDVDPNSKLLGVAMKAADLLYSRFINAKSSEIPGHQEIEIALLKLYKITKEPRYLRLAETLIHRRGNTRLIWLRFLRSILSTSRRMNRVSSMRKKYLEENPTTKEFKLPGSAHYDMPKGIKRRSFVNFASGKYLQNHKQLGKQLTPEGHAVRFSYFFTAAAMLMNETQEFDLVSDLNATWDHMVQKRMYVTGGIGSLPLIEGFGRDYELDPEFAYCETCAAIGSLFWNWEMTLLTNQPKFADLFEWQLYNAASVGISLEGNSYLYRNPLTSKGKLLRKGWYSVPCCPSNLSRTWAALGQYIYTYSSKGLNIHQYISNNTLFPVNDGILISLNSSFPWQGQVRIQIQIKDPFRWSIVFRIPSWSERFTIFINGKEEDTSKIIHSTSNHCSTASGYSPYKARRTSITREWTDGDFIDLNFYPKIKLLKSDPKVQNRFGDTAISYGPLVYCLESSDNPEINLYDLKIDPSTLKVEQSELFGGIIVIKGKLIDSTEFTAIPYSYWANRGDSKMNVMLNTKKEFIVL